MATGDLRARFDAVRARSVEMASRLSPSEWRIQSMETVSPPWWNLGHTSWFFARNLLRPLGRADDRDRALDGLLNSYYESFGPRLARGRRGSLSRPTNEEVLDYRASVDGRVRDLLDGAEGDARRLVEAVVPVGVQHEEQHQELMVTEIKHIRFQDAPHLREPYAPRPEPAPAAGPAEARWLDFDGGLLEFGNLEGGWCWDAETPVHRAFLVPFSVRSRPVTHGEFAEFVEDGGYRNPLLWLSNGWDAVREGNWTAPLYWERDGDGRWIHWTLQGARPVDPAEPVVHVSFHEAHAIAAWASENFRDLRGARLPTEREWEHAARASGAAVADGTFLESGRFHPAPPARPEATGFLGDAWEWTSSHFEPYPGYRPWQGALAEYNGKFMDNQRVLRGGSAVTPRDHVRVSYRNFWPADTRFQFSGVRLARDA